MTEPILSVDLAGGTVETEPLSSREYAFGGRGTNQELLAERMRPGVEPLDPASWIMLGTGAFTGSDIPASPRLAVDFRNVLNGGVGSANCGGFFGAALRNAGVAHLCITGAAEHPVYLEVDRGRVALRDARHLWGMTVSRTEEAIRSELGDSGARTLAIGPAGERMVRFACLIADRGRAAGYGGPGAVFGSKNLKAVAVRSGGGDGPGRIGEAAGAVARRLRESAFGRVHAEGGTLWAYLRNGSARAHGVRNMTSEYWSDQAIAAVSREAVERSMIARRACFSCPVPCSALFAVDGATVEGVQANMYRAFATNVDVRDAGTLLRANRLVNELGLDCDHTSAVVAWAMELVDRGLLAQREIGFPLRWGAGGAMLGLIEAIGYRRGFGDLLAEGLDAASRSLGEETRPYANLVKGNAVMEAGFRSHPAWALGIVTSAKAAGHLRGAPAQEYQAEAGSLRPETSQDLFGFVFPGLEATPQQRAALVAWQERYKAVLDCMGLCTLSSAWMDAELYHPEEIAGLYSALTGIETSGETLMAYGERLNNLERAFNLLYAGFDRCHDYPPRRFMEEPLQEGRYAGARLERGEWEAMLDAYYREHHWDEPTGRPFPETLERHGLSRLAEQARDRLPA